MKDGLRIETRHRYQPISHLSGDISRLIFLFGYTDRDVLVTIAKDPDRSLLCSCISCDLVQSCYNLAQYITGYCINTLRLRQNGCYFADDIFKCNFLTENISISIKISLKFVPRCPINNIPVLVQIMACTDQATSHYQNNASLTQP